MFCFVMFLYVVLFFCLFWGGGDVGYAGRVWVGDGVLLGLGLGMG